jgi:hypothetical protein
MCVCGQRGMGSVPASSWAGLDGLTSPKAAQAFWTTFRSILRVATEVSSGVDMGKSIRLRT